MKLNISDIITLPVCLAIILLVFQPDKLYGQEIDFGQYQTSSVTVIGERNLEFGELFKGDVESITLGSGLEGVVSLMGISYLDAFVDLSPYPFSYLYLNGDDSCITASCRMDLSLTTAYANSGQLIDNTTGAVVFSGGTVRFPIRLRSTLPPGPPPTPTHTGYTPPTATAHIYFYGSVTSNMSNAAGNYWRNITVTVTYN